MFDILFLCFLFSTSYLLNVFWGFLFHCWCLRYWCSSVLPSSILTLDFTIHQLLNTKYFIPDHICLISFITCLLTGQLKISAASHEPLKLSRCKTGPIIRPPLNLLSHLCSLFSGTATILAPIYPSWTPCRHYWVFLLIHSPIYNQTVSLVLPSDLSQVFPLSSFLRSPPSLGWHHHALLSF